jgi:hypothetical protein
VDGRPAFRQPRDGKSWTDGAASRPVSDPNWRIGHAERATVADLLSKHCVAGRLTLDELDERLAEIWAAKTQHDLDDCLTDLPPLTDDQAPTSLASWLQDGRTLLRASTLSPGAIAGVAGLVLLLGFLLVALPLLSVGWHVHDYGR